MSIHKPQNRNEFKEYILRKLGAPVIQINVSDDQVEMMIEESLQWFADYHYNGSEHVYYVKVLDADDIANRYIDTPEEIIGVNEVYSLAQSYLSFDSGTLTGGWNMLMDLVWNTSGGTIVSYVMSKMNFEFITQMLVGQSPLRFNEHTNRVYIDVSWARWNPGDAIVLDAYKRADPEANPDIWNDRFLKDYATNKVKYMWGQNISKFSGMTLPGGVQFNGTEIKNEAQAAMIEIEQMIRDYSMPPRDYVY